MSARYSAYVGKRVEVLYRSSDIYLPATGTLVADSGRSVFLEERCERKGRLSTFRWEIPYGFITRVTDVSPPPPAPRADEVKLLLEVEENDLPASRMNWGDNSGET